MSITNRTQVTELIVMTRIKKGLSWAKIAKAVGQSKEWPTAALLGQMQMTKQQAKAAGKLLDLPADAVLLLQQVPYKGSLPTAVPTGVTVPSASLAPTPFVETVTLPVSGVPSTLKVIAVIVLPASGETVAWRSKRCPARKREVMGVPGSLNENSMLGGVRRESVGAACSEAAAASATASGMAASGMAARPDGE